MHVGGDLRSRGWRVVHHTERANNTRVCFSAMIEGSYGRRFYASIIDPRSESNRSSYVHYTRHERAG